MKRGLEFWFDAGKLTVFSESAPGAGFFVMGFSLVGECCVVMFALLIRPRLELIFRRSFYVLNIRSSIFFLIPGHWFHENISGNTRSFNYESGIFCLKVFVDWNSHLEILQLDMLDWFHVHLVVLRVLVDIFGEFIMFLNFGMPGIAGIIWDEKLFAYLFPSILHKGAVALWHRETPIEAIIMMKS